MPIQIRGGIRRDRFTVEPSNPLGLPPLAGFTPILNEQFTGGALNNSRWNPRNNDRFGLDGGRTQLYMAANVVVGTGSAGATNNASCKLFTKRETIAGNPEITAGMLDTKGVGYGLPPFCAVISRMKIPHGHGLWPAWWMTAMGPPVWSPTLGRFISGADLIELDCMEGFHAQIPGKTLSTLHRADNGGTPRYNINKATAFYEAPTYTPGWVTIMVTVTPENGVPGQPTDNVRFKAFLNGSSTPYWNYLDTQALLWTTNTTKWNTYYQGCQTNGEWMGDPDGPLGYSALLNDGAGGCLVSGTPPNACATTVGGYPVIRAGAPGATATFSDPATTLEVDFLQAYEFTG